MSTARAWTREDPRTKDLHPRKKRWQVVYEDPATSKRRTKAGFSTKAQAEAWREQFLTDVRQGSYVDPTRGSVAFETVALDWLATHKTTKAKTRAGYRAIIAACPFKDTPISDITYEAIRRWVAEMAARLKPTTVRNNFYVLSAVLDYAVDVDRLSRNPAAKARRHLPKATSMRRQEAARYPLTPGDVQRICGALPEPWDLYARLAAATGMRPEELTGLRVRDVDATDGILHINRVLVDVNGVLIAEDRAKTAHSIRSVVLDGDTAARLEVYVDQHRARALAWFTEHPDETHPGDDLPLFVGVGVGRANGKTDLERLDYSKPMRHGLFYGRYWKAAVKACGLPNSIRFYDLRHAHISWLVGNLNQPGALTLKEIQDRVGHSSAVMTLDRYAHAPASDNDRQRRALSGSVASEAASNVLRLPRRG